MQRTRLTFKLGWPLLGGALLAGAVGAMALSWLAQWPLSSAWLQALPSSLMMAATLPAASAISGSWSLAQRGVSRVLPTWAASAALVGLLSGGMSWGWASLCGTAGPHLSAVTTATGLLASLFFLVALMLADAVNAQARWLEAQQRQEQSMDRAREAELLMLRTQIQPHFLFNCLNSISALTQFDPAGARDMTLQLAQYFRQTLVLTQRRLVTLEEELAHGQVFLDIERVRFGDRLQVQVLGHERAQAVLMPPMLLQPLLENALKHGVAECLDGGTVRVEAMVQDDWLRLSVTNPLPPDPPAHAPPLAAHQGTGTGLANIRQRLASLYGTQAQLELSRQDGEFRALITLPRRYAHHDFDAHPGPDR